MSDQASQGARLAVVRLRIISIRAGRQWLVLEGSIKWTLERACALMKNSTELSKDIIQARSDRGESACCCNL